MSSGRCESNIVVSRDLGLLAPRFREAVERAIAECRQQGYDAYVYEAYRSMELQQLYYQRGRTVVPPLKPVTNAHSNLYSWHGYGLAVDVVSAGHGWDKPEAWFREVAEIFRKHNCRWGGEWKCKDLPHFQWGCCKPSPSDRARDLVHLHGIASVWEAVDAA